MRTPERSLSPPGWRTAQDGMTRARRAFAAAPPPLKIIVAAVLCVLAPPLAALLVFAGLVYAPYAVWARRRTSAASLSASLWGVATVAALAHGPVAPRYAQLVP